METQSPLLDFHLHRRRLNAHRAWHGKSQRGFHVHNCIQIPPEFPPRVNLGGRTSFATPSSKGWVLQIEATLHNPSPLLLFKS